MKREASYCQRMKSDKNIMKTAEINYTWTNRGNKCVNPYTQDSQKYINHLLETKNDIRAFGQFFFPR